MPFDPETAYSGDHQYHDRVKDVSWEIIDGATVTGLKARFGTIDTPDLTSVAAGLGLSTDAAAVVVWEPKPSDTDAEDWEPAFAPKSGHLLRLDTGEGWLIHAVVKSQLAGKWNLLVDKEIANA